MTPKSTLFSTSSDDNLVQQLIAAPLATPPDRIELANISAAVVCVLNETDDCVIRAALCERLLQTLGHLRECCDTELSPHLIDQLIAGESLSNSVPVNWQDSVTQVDYALALTQAVMGGTLPAGVEKDLTRLLHDMVWLLAEFVKEPYITAH